MMTAAERISQLDDRASLLIVDDERGPAESLRMIFKPSYNVFTASGGQQALEIVHSNANRCRDARSAHAGDVRRRGHGTDQGL